MVFSFTLRNKQGLTEMLWEVLEESVNHTSELILVQLPNSAATLGRCQKRDQMSLTVLMQGLPRDGSLVGQKEADICQLTCGSDQVSIVHSLQWSTRSSRCLRVFQLNSHQNHFLLWFTLSTVITIAVSIPPTKSCVRTRQP